MLCLRSRHEGGWGSQKGTCPGAFMQGSNAPLPKATRTLIAVASSLYP